MEEGKRFELSIRV